MKQADRKPPRNGAERDNVRAALTLQDPMSTLPPTARAILIAAREILLTEGIPGMTVSAVTKKAGANQASVSYYFGGKSRLIAAVVDATVHDSYVELLDSTRDLPLGSKRMDAFIASKQAIAESEEAYAPFLAVLPYALQHDHVRETLDAAWDGYRSFSADLLGLEAVLEPREVEALTRLLIAVVDGFAIQRALKGAHLDLTDSFALFRHMLSVVLPELAAEQDRV